MTKTSRKWRDKRINKIRVMKKIHNLILGTIAGIMTVFFLLSLLGLDNVNEYVVLMAVISAIWLSIFVYANNLDTLKEGDE